MYNIFHCRRARYLPLDSFSKCLSSQRNWHSQGSSSCSGGCTRLGENCRHGLHVTPGVANTAVPIHYSLSSTSFESDSVLRSSEKQSAKTTVTNTLLGRLNKKE